MDDMLKKILAHALDAAVENELPRAAAEIQEAMKWRKILGAGIVAVILGICYVITALSVGWQLGAALWLGAAGLAMLLMLGLDLLFGGDDK